MNQTSNLQAGTGAPRDKTEMKIITDRLDTLKLNLSVGISNIRYKVERLNGPMPEIPTTELVPTQNEPPVIERIMGHIADMEYLASSLLHVDQQFSKIVNS